MTWEVEAALKKTEKCERSGRDQVNIETLNADETIAKELVAL